jgi:cell division protein FtsN
MKNVLIFLCFVLLLCNGCKYFKKSSKPVETLTADTLTADKVIPDSASYYSNVSNAGNVPVQTVAPHNATTGRYYMIVGCFTVQSNADKYAEKLRGMGYESQIISGKDNFQMVAAKSYNNYRESVNEIDKFRNDVTPNAWVYLKR